MSDNVTGTTHMPAHSADTGFFVRRGMSKGYQLFSLLTPPLYTAFVLSRYGRSRFTVNRLLRATWIGGAVGVASGGAFEYARSVSSNPDNLRARRIRAAYDTASLRADDHATIGGILFAVLTPAVFWNRANLVNLILGGAGIGSAVGLLTHYGRSMTGDTPPKVPVPGQEPGQKQM